jgi:hypothetical protein
MPRLRLPHQWPLFLNKLTSGYSSLVQFLVSSKVHILDVFPLAQIFSLTSFRTGASSHVIAIMNDQSQLKSRVGLPSVRKRGTEAAVPHPDQRQSTSHQFVR